MRPLLALALFIAAPAVLAQDAPGSGTLAGDAPLDAATVQRNLDYVWVLVCAALVFLMQAGFALLETGLTRAKNAANIIMKNVMDAAAGGLVFFLVGFGIMFGATAGGWFGTTGFALTGLAEQPQTWVYLFFFFQVVFAATATTIVSGAVAERVKFSAYLVFSLAMCGLIYPVFGAWAWGGLLAGEGWLERLGFHDFAGSTVVHSVGGWAALAGALVVGARRGRFDADGRAVPMPGHSLPQAALGVFILWFGWFGFNAGSTAVGDPVIARIAVNTFLSAAAGAVAAMALTWRRAGKPDVGMTLNGVLAGLVAITAGCDAVVPASALAIGLVAGGVVVLACAALEWWRVDDPVGAVAVHGVCGAWGTLAVALFAASGFSFSALCVQALGVAAAFAWTFPLSLGLFLLLRHALGLRIDEETESGGLDLHEHGAFAYPEFLVAPAVSELAAERAEPALRLDAMQLEASQALRMPFARPVVSRPEA